MLHNIKLRSLIPAKLIQAASKALGVFPKALSRIVKKKASMRVKSLTFVFVVALDVTLKNPQDEKRIAARLRARGRRFGRPLMCRPPLSALPHAPPFARSSSVSAPPVCFFALTLAEAGARPIVLERGRDVDIPHPRRSRVYWSRGAEAFSPSSNVQFGEGGAGTFSDGKLNTGTKDPRGEHILRTFVRFGAPHDILIDAKPHIGTDKLCGVVKAMRMRILELGGEVRFGARRSLLHSNGHVAAIRYIDAPGRTGLPPKPSCSPSATVPAIRSNHFWRAASRSCRSPSPSARASSTPKASSTSRNTARRPVIRRSARRITSWRCICQAARSHTFCMCPGGTVVAAASEPESVVTNGMSCYARDGINANSALLVGVGPEDFGSEHPLAGMFLQREIERRAFVLGGRSGKAPCQTVGDLLAGRASVQLGSVRPSYQPGVVPGDLADLLPAPIIGAMRQNALPAAGSPPARV